jgi:hypothetical protein
MGAEAIKTAEPVGGRTNSRGLYAQHHNNRMAVPGADRNRHAADRGPDMELRLITLPQIMTVSLDEFARRMRKRRLRKAIEACARGMDVCQRMVDNELANKSAYQTRQMLLIKELSDMGES